jgi:hypothetical protein
MNLSRGEVPKNTFFINYLMNKGVLMQINCIMSLEALQNYRIRQSMLILKAIRVVAEVLNLKNIKNSPTRGIDVGTYQQVNRIW